LLNGIGWDAPCEPMVHVSDIKLIRTDTTLDLNQKAEKGMICNMEVFSFYTLRSIFLTES